MLTRATSIGVTRISERHLTMYAVHLIRIALAYYEFECAQVGTAQSNTESKLDKACATVIEQVDELALDTWYPSEVCNNVYACILHTIGTVRINQADQCVTVNQSILTLLVRAYETDAQQDYLAPQTGRTVKRHELFATGADVIGALLDTLCSKSESISKLFEGRPEVGLAGAEVLSNGTIGSASSKVAATVRDDLPPPPHPRLLKNLRITRAK